MSVGPGGSSGAGKSNQQEVQRKALTKELVLKDYRQRLKDNIHSLNENFKELLRLAKCEEDPLKQVSRVVQASLDQYEMEVRAANMARSAQALIKLINDLKQFLILNDFAFINETVERQQKEAEAAKKEVDDKLLSIRDEIASDLNEIDSEIVNSYLF